MVIGMKLQQSGEREYSGLMGSPPREALDALLPAERAAGTTGAR
jgi:hypothetical protein